MTESKHAYRFETLQTHAGQESPDPATDARAVPIYATTSYVFKDSATAAGRFALAEPGNIYTRLTNPTTSVFEERVAALEGGVGALGVASGSAAITIAVQNIATAGDHIVASTNLYGGTVNLFGNTLVEQGLTTTFVGPDDLAAVEAAIQPNTKLLYAETLGNPNSDVLDLEGWAEIAHRHGLPLIVDATFSTPYLLRPIEHGADVVVHSATKFMGGHGTVMGGVIVDSGKFDWAAHADRFPGLAKPNPSSCSPTRAGLRRTSPRSVRPFCATRAPRSRRSTRSCCSRAWKPSRCALSATWRTPLRSSSSSTTTRRLSA